MNMIASMEARIRTEERRRKWKKQENGKGCVLLICIATLILVIIACAPVTQRMESQSNEQRHKNSNVVEQPFYRMLSTRFADGMRHPISRVSLRKLGKSLGWIYGAYKEKLAGPDIGSDEHGGQFSPSLGWSLKMIICPGKLKE